MVNDEPMLIFGCKHPLFHLIEIVGLSFESDWHDSPHSYYYLNHSSKLLLSFSYFFVSLFSHLFLSFDLTWHVFPPSQWHIPNHSSMAMQFLSLPVCSSIRGVGYPNIFMPCLRITHSTRAISTKGLSSSFISILSNKMISRHINLFSGPWLPWFYLEISASLWFYVSYILGFSYYLCQMHTKLEDFFSYSKLI